MYSSHTLYEWCVTCFLCYVYNTCSVIQDDTISFQIIVHPYKCLLYAYIIRTFTKTCLSKIYCDTTISIKFVSQSDVLSASVILPRIWLSAEVVVSERGLRLSPTSNGDRLLCLIDGCSVYYASSTTFGSALSSLLHLSCSVICNQLFNGCNKM